MALMLMNALQLYTSSQGSRKKSLLMAGPLREGGGAFRKKELFLEHFFSPKFQNVNGHEARGVGWLGLNGPAIKRRTFFCGFPKRQELTSKVLS